MPFRFGPFRLSRFPPSQQQIPDPSPDQLVFRLELSAKDIKVSVLKPLKASW